MAQRLAHRGCRSGGHRFKSHPRLTSQSWSSYQLNQLGSKAASDSTLIQLTTCGVSNTSKTNYRRLGVQLPTRDPLPSLPIPSLLPFSSSSQWPYLYHPHTKSPRIHTIQKSRIWVRTPSQLRAWREGWLTISNEWIPVGYSCSKNLHYNYMMVFLFIFARSAASFSLMIVV